MRGRAASLVAAACLAAAAMPLGAQTLYRWTDAQGKVQYSDKPPKGFAGEVTRIETEVEKTTLPPAPAAPPVAAPRDEAKAAPPAEDLLAKRRATRARLEADLARARDKVAAAKKALQGSEAPEPDERQVVQQRGAPGGMHGMAPRSNCRVEVAAGGRKVLMCPTSVPTSEYHDRIARLEENLRNAEAELEAAELAWRRGVD